MKEEIQAFCLAVCVSFLICALSNAYLVKGDSVVKSGKVFKIKDATYQCKQINKLEYVEK